MGIFDRLKLSSPENNEIKDTRKKFQDFVDQITIDLAHWWGISDKEIKGKTPKVQIVTPEKLLEYRASRNFPNRTCYVDRTNEILIPSSEISKTEGGILGWKAALGEEVGHFIEGLYKNRPPKEREFFGGLSRLYIAKQVPGSFNEEYRKEIRVAAFYNKLYSEHYMQNKDIEDILKIENIDSKDREDFVKLHRYNEIFLDHILQKPAAFLLTKIINMKPEERNLLLLDSSKFYKTVMEGVKGLEQIQGKVDERLNKNNEQYFLGKYPDISKFSDEELKQIYTPEELETMKKFFFKESKKGLEDVGKFFEMTERGSLDKETPETKEGPSLDEIIDIISKKNMKEANDLLENMKKLREKKREIEEAEKLLKEAKDPETYFDEAWKMARSTPKELVEEQIRELEKQIKQFAIKEVQESIHETEPSKGVALLNSFSSSDAVKNIKEYKEKIKEVEKKSEATTASALPKTRAMQSIAKTATQQIRCTTCSKIFSSDAEFYNNQIHPCVRVVLRCPVCGSEDVD